MIFVNIYNKLIVKCKSYQDYSEIFLIIYFSNLNKWRKIILSLIRSSKFHDKISSKYSLIQLFKIDNVKIIRIIINNLIKV